MHGSNQGVTGVQAQGQTTDPRLRWSQHGTGGGEAPQLLARLEGVLQTGTDATDLAVTG